MKVAILCGGPSLERGISLNSARSVMDHLQSEALEIVPIYFDHFKKAYAISRAQLYSNTPSDFDFKLSQTGKVLTEKQLIKKLKAVDLVFPAMHGPFGEDGEIQRFLETHHIPFVGSGSEACKKAFDKHESGKFIASLGFESLPSLLQKIHSPRSLKEIRHFFEKNKIKRAIVKPASGGSSIGVHSVSTPEEALEKVELLFSKRIDTRVVIEPFCEGKEFTVILLQNRFKLPVAVLPTEIEIDYKDHQIFDTRKKYLATRQVTYHCPPRFSNEIIEKIQIQAEQLFSLFGMKDFARFDGWLLEDGRLVFTDFNPISGMEQNSFLFMQSAQIGLSHRAVLRQILKSACGRYEIPAPPKEIVSKIPKKKINVLFGGATAERQVSLMSGTNVWLKLRRSEKFSPEPFLLDPQNKVWKLPYAFTLNHTVEEIVDMCKQAPQAEKRLKELKEKVLLRLALESEIVLEPHELPQQMNLEHFIEKSPFVFIALHGGLGEDGTLQKKLEKAKIKFNGSGSEASFLGMDKYKTGEKLSSLKKEGIYSAEKKILKLEKWNEKKELEMRRLWKSCTQELKASSLIAKPIGDGCSAGIVRLWGFQDLARYIGIAKKGQKSIPPHTLKGQETLIEMPPHSLMEVMLEPFIITDKVQVIQNKIKWETKTDWIEITMGVLEKKGIYHALNPSVTVASGNVLSLEEKFQGGTGVNITPPPQPFVKKSAIEKAKTRMEKVAKTLGIKNYARIDAFMQIHTGELLIIEANTLPGLTPSTVIYHQALSEEKPLFPTEFLETIIESA